MTRQLIGHSIMEKASLLFIPSPGAGHLGSAVETANLLLNHDDRISVTLLIYKFRNDTKLPKYIDSLSASTTSNRIQFIHLPSPEDEDTKDKNPRRTIFSVIESQKANVREIVTKLVNSESFPQLAAFVLDMFCSTMIDVANEFSVPSYIFFTSNAAFLGFLLHIQILHDEHNVDVTQFKDSDEILDLPTLMNPLPAKVFPSVVLNKESLPFILDCPRKYRQTKGIIVNTFLELEAYAINSLNSDAIANVPPVYPVGPILNLKGNGDDAESDEFKDIILWLDKQPPLSVVFLCFGSMGSFGVEQVKEIASALQNAKYRFLWSLRKPPTKDQMGLPSDYANPQEILPEVFFDRTAEIGKIIGWAPQVAILGHPAVGGFVSHCGWNSTLESIWFGVPIATWPLYAEQQFNAFETVVELGLAVEIKMDYRKDVREDTEAIIIRADEIEKGIRNLMEIDVEKRKKVKQMSEISRKTLMENGSSYTYLSNFIADVINNVQ